MVAQGDASKIASKAFGQKEKESLLAMKALIEKSLQSMEGGDIEVAKEEIAPKEEAREDEDMEMLL